MPDMASGRWHTVQPEQKHREIKKGEGKWHTAV